VTVTNPNKHHRFEYIEINELYVGRTNVRVENANDEEELNNLAEHIGKHGLLEPIVIFDKNELTEEHPCYSSRQEFPKRYEILAGQRRWKAFKKLNNENSGLGWNTIPCHLRSPPDNDDDAIAISLGEGLTQLPYTLADTISACDKLFRTYSDPAIVAKKTGISKVLVERYVKYARLPSMVQENLGAIYKNPKTAVKLGVEAADALAWSKDGEVSDERVLELAKTLGIKKRVSDAEYKKLKQAAEENPGSTLKDMEEESQKIRNPKAYKITLDATTADKLETVAKSNGNEPSDEITELIEYGLDRRVGKLS
jgi:ParB/RepB/Spo0J family partition protein